MFKPSAAPIYNMYLMCTVYSITVTSAQGFKEGWGLVSVRTQFNLVSYWPKD